MQIRMLMRGMLLVLAIPVFFSCEPLATGFGDTEEAQYYEAKNITVVPDTFSNIKVMTWNIRFGAGRLPWFGDACGDRILFTEEEIMTTLQLIADRINLLKPDILLLQEVDLNSKRSAYIDQVRWILDHTYFNYAVSGAQWKTQFIPSDGLGRIEETNATYSRWKISEAQRIELGLRYDQDALTRYFYERCCLVTCRVEVPHAGKLYALNIHASSFATDSTRYRQIARFMTELGRIDGMGGVFVAGGDLNAIPPNSDKTDYCLVDMCPGESFHQPGDNPMHKEGSNYFADINVLQPLYDHYLCAVPPDVYKLNQPKYFSQTNTGDSFWDRTLDYLFTNYRWVPNSEVTHQEAVKESDHVPVSALFILPK